MVHGIIQHELLHALGINHEQNRPDRDDFVQVNFANIEEKKLSNFERRDDSVVLGTPYDYGSVMHYRRNAFAIDANVDTITPLRATDQQLGQRDGLTEWDIIKVRLLYQCISGPREITSYVTSLCTSDCPCWKGATGCNANDECVGGLVCVNSECLHDSGGQGGGSSTVGCKDDPGWLDEIGYGCDW